jgi:hypothetical protein
MAAVAAGVAAVSAIAALAVCSAAGIAQMVHSHEGTQCAKPDISCASAVSPAFAPDGSLWVAFAAGHISIAHSPDLGRTFGPAVAVNPDPLRLDSGPDERPKLAIDSSGRIAVAYAIFKDSAFNGQVLTSYSTDGGRSFAPSRPITRDPESQRFEAISFDPEGSLFAAWLDKRNRAPARANGENYVGAGLAFAWSKDGGETYSDTRVAQDNTCECCRLGVAFAGAGRPVVLFRNVFGGTVRDHAITTFSDPVTPGPIYRVSVDDWAIDVCPHAGPSLALAPDGPYHVTWFTNGSVRKGLFYARSTDAGRTFSEPMPIGRPDRNPSRPFVLATSRAVWLAWKEFDGDETTVLLMNSRDWGKNWTSPKTVARTSDSSDHPLLIAQGDRVFLSWMTRAQGYQFISLEDVP